MLWEYLGRTPVQTWGHQRRLSERGCVYIETGRMIRELARLRERSGVFEAEGIKCVAIGGEK